MFYLSILNILFFFLIQIIKVRLLSKKLKGFINPITITFVFTFPIELFKVVLGPAFALEEGLANKYYIFAILMTNVSNVIELMLIKIAFFFSEKKRVTLLPSFINVNINRMRMLCLAFLFLLLYILSFAILAQYSFGIINWILNPREGYQYHRNGVGVMWALSISFLSIACTLFLLYIDSFWKSSLAFGFILYCVFLLGSKALLLDFMSFFMVILWLKKNPYLGKIFIIGVPFALGIMILNFMQSISEFELESVFSYFDYYLNSAQYYQAYFEGDLPLFKGKIMFSNIWSIIPRGVFSDKPYVYGILHVNEYFFPGAAEATHTPAFGGPVAFFADFGIFGVLVLSLFNPSTFLFYYFYNSLLDNFTIKEIQSNGEWLMTFVWFVSPALMFYFFFPINILLFCFYLRLFALFNKKYK